MATVPMGLAAKFGHRTISSESRSERKALVWGARLFGVAGVVAYNWWVPVPFIHGMLPSVNGFFSDIEATGMPHATLLQDADMVSGLCLLTAFFLLLFASAVHGLRRREWRWLAWFAAAGFVGGRFPYACAAGLSSVCDAKQWHMQLPVHHYLHMAAGVVEFSTITVVVLLAVRRTRGTRSVPATVYRSALGAFAVAYPALAAAYLTNRLGAFVEPVFFVAFTAVILAELYEADRAGVPALSATS